MADIFDTIETEEKPRKIAPAARVGDIFDEVAGAGAAGGGDIFDQVAEPESPGLFQQAKSAFISRFQPAAEVPDRSGMLDAGPIEGEAPEGTVGSWLTAGGKGVAHALTSTAPAMVNAVGRRFADRARALDEAGAGGLIDSDYEPPAGNEYTQTFLKNLSDNLGVGVETWQNLGKPLELGPDATKGEQRAFGAGESLGLVGLAAPFGAVAGPVALGVGTGSLKYDELIRAGYDRERAQTAALIYDVAETVPELFSFRIGLSKKIPFLRKAIYNQVSELLGESGTSATELGADLWAANPGKSREEIARMYADNIGATLSETAIQTMIQAPIQAGGMHLLSKVAAPKSQTEQAAEERYGGQSGVRSEELGEKAGPGKPISQPPVAVPGAGKVEGQAGAAKPVQAASLEAEADRRGQFEDDVILREKLSALPTEAIHDMVLTDPVSGARSRLAYELLEKDSPAEITGISDARGLGAIDKHLGHKAGDDFVQKVVEAHRDEGIPVYRASEKGDEFLTRWNGLTNEQIDAKLEAVNKRLRNADLTVENPDGSKRYFTNLELYTAQGRNYNEAGQLLGEKKRTNQPEGYVKGEFPRHLVELTEEQWLAKAGGKSNPAPATARIPEVTPVTPASEVTPSAAPSTPELRPTVSPETTAAPEVRPLSLAEQAKQGFVERQGGVVGALGRLREIRNKGKEVQSSEFKVQSEEEQGKGEPTELYSFPGPLRKVFDWGGKKLSRSMVKFFDFAGEHIDPEWKQQGIKFFRTPALYVEEHPEAGPLFDRNIERGKNRHRDGRFIFDADQEAGYSGVAPMLRLGKSEIADLSKILVEGDRKRVRYTPQQLAEQFKASDRVAEGYIAGRNLIERLQAVIIERTKEIALAPYETDPQLHDKLSRVADDLTQIREKAEREKYMSKLFHDQASVLDAAAQNALTRIQKYFDLIHDYIGIFEENPGYIPRTREEGAFHVRAFEVRLSDAEASQLRGIFGYGRKARKRFTPEEAKEKFNLSDKLTAAYTEALEKADQDPVLTRTWEAGKDTQKALSRIIDSVARREVFMEPANTYAGAKSLKTKVETKPEQYFGANYEKGKQYEYAVVENKRLSEDVMADIGNPAAREAILERSVRLAQTRGEISLADAEAISDSLITVLSEEVAKRGAGRAFVRRQENLIEGYQTADLDKVIISHVTGMAGWLNKALYSVRALRDMKDVKDRDVVRWANEYYKDSLKNAGKMDEWVAKARGAATFWRLGGVIKTMVQNSFQQFVTGWPELSRYTRDPGKVLIDAEKDVLFRHLTEFDKRVLAEAVESGQADAQYMRSITGAADMGPERGFNRLVDLSMKGFGLVETGLNRKPAYLAAMRLFTGQKKADGSFYGTDLNGKPYRMSYADAMKKAEEYVRATHYEISRANEPEFVRKLGPLGHGAYTFQSFTANHLNWLFNRMRHGEVRVLGRYIFATWALGGAAAFPFGDEIDAILVKWFGYPIKMKLRAFIRHSLRAGQDLEDLIMNGVPAAVAGIDMSRSVQVNTPLPIAVLLDTDKSVEEKATGAIGGVVVSFIRSGGYALQQDWQRSAENAAPNVAGNILRAQRLYREGVTTASGNPVFDEKGEQLRLTEGEAGWTSLGFRPMRQSRYSELSRTRYNLEKHYGNERQNIINGFRKSEGGEEWMEKADKFNEKVLNDPMLFGIVPLITAKTFRGALTNKPDRGEMLWMEENLGGEEGEE